MKFLESRRLILTLLAGSVLLNLAILGYLARSGGLRRIFLKLDLTTMPEGRALFQMEDEARFRRMPNTPAEIVFAGDSLIAAGPWSEFYSEIRNRGIGGERTQGLLTRLDEITESKPLKVFLLIGSNDLSNEIPVAQLLRNYREILKKIRQDSPTTIIYVLSILPVNPEFPRPTYTSDDAREANRGLAKLVEEMPGVHYLDLQSLVSDKAGNLRREFTIDGLHLNFEAYLAIREALAGPVLRDESKANPRTATP